MALHVKPGVLVLFTAAAVLAAGGDGIRPRGSSAEYPARAGNTAATVGAAVIAPDHVRKLFATDLNHAGYVVIELAVYPEPGREINLSQSDFMLRAGSEGNAVRAASGETIAEVLADRHAPKDTQPPQIGGRNVDIVQSANIGYGTGTDPYGRRVGGVYGGGGMGVGVGGPAAGGPGSGAPAAGYPDPQDPMPPPAPRPGMRDPALIQRELEDKALPEGKTTEPVAGYLYFPRPSKKKNEPLTLMWYGPDGSSMRLALAPPAK